MQNRFKIRKEKKTVIAPNGDITFQEDISDATYDNPIKQPKTIATLSSLQETPKPNSCPYKNQNNLFSTFMPSAVPSADDNDNTLSTSAIGDNIPDVFIDADSNIIRKNDIATLNAASAQKTNQFTSYEKAAHIRPVQNQADHEKAVNIRPVQNQEQPQLPISTAKKPSFWKELKKSFHHKESEENLSEEKQKHIFKRS